MMITVRNSLVVAAAKDRGVEGSRTRRHDGGYGNGDGGGGCGDEIVWCPASVLVGRSYDAQQPTAVGDGNKPSDGVAVLVMLVMGIKDGKRIRRDGVTEKTIEVWVCLIQSKSLYLPCSKMKKIA